MQRLYLMWFTKNLENDKDIDETYKKVLNAGLLMYQHLHFGNHNPDRVLQLAKKTNEIILLHMHFEIATMEKLHLANKAAHEADHQKYIEKFDLECKYATSDRMRIIMTAKMIKEFLNHHFYNYDIPDLQKIKEHFTIFEKLAS